MEQLTDRLRAVRDRIAAAEQRFGREGEVTLLAVSKTKPIEALQEALAAGQHALGESYLQEALAKVETIGAAAEWHFIGPIQSNKTRPIAGHFDWVHSVDRLKVAQRLSEQRPAERAPLNVCLQVNVSQEPGKSGCTLAELSELAREVAALPRLRLRGLMCIPAPEEAFEAQRRPFRRLREALVSLNEAGFGLDTLSMGMSDDLEAAIAEGATIVRIGSAIFGARYHM